MFALKVAKAQTKAADSPSSKLAAQRSTLLARPFLGGAVEQTHMLQSTISNQARLRLIAQRGVGPTGKEADGDHEQEANPESLTAQTAKPGPSWDFSKIPLFSPDRANRPQTPPPFEALPLLGIIQPKLAVGPVDNPLEREADRIADHVMRMPDPDLSVTPTPPQLNQKCAACEKEAQTSQTKTARSSEVVAGETPGIVHEVLRSPGWPLAPGTRAFFEPRFGRDFSQVRVHADSRAAASAGAIGARAYTMGSDVVFGANEYSPSTKDGKQLMAHELTHVVQQHSSSQGRALKGERVLATSQASQPALMRQEVSASVDDMDSDQSQDQLASSQGAKSAKEKTKPTPQPAERVPTATSASEGALKALEAARALHDQRDPVVWFDSWGNDLRDNNLSGTIDEKVEQGIPDGTHYGKTFDAKICSSPSDTTDQCPPSDQSMIKVQYKVCIDVPIESYKAAGANVSTSRWIPTFFGELSKKPNWTVWKKPAAPSRLLDGDIVAADNPDHQHAGMVDTGILNFVINLPGPTSSRRFHLFDPSGKNDMVSVPRALFESFLSIDWTARLNK